MSREDAREVVMWRGKMQEAKREEISKEGRVEVISERNGREGRWARERKRKRGDIGE